MATFPQTIPIPASALDVVEWLERTNRELWFVGDDKHAAYLSWIEDGPMGMAIGTYIPSPAPVKIAFEGYVTIDESEPGVLLPFNPMEVDPEAQFRELEGLFFATVEPVDMHNCLLAAEVQDAEPMLVERAVELVEDLAKYYRERRVAEARRQARELAKFSDADLQKARPNHADTPVEKDLRIAAPAASQLPEAPQIPNSTRVMTYQRLQSR